MILDPVSDYARINKEALREGFKKAGKPIDEGALALAIEVARDARFMHVFTAPEKLATTSSVAVILLDAEEKGALPKGEWDKYLERIKLELIYGLRSQMPALIKTAVKGFPKKPSTGRKEKLSPSEQKKACNLVSKYYRDGDSMRAAYEKVAAEMDCSPRTVQRIWQQRRSLRSTVRNQSPR